MHFVLEMLQGYATQLEMMHYFAGIMKCVTRMNEICPLANFIAPTGEDTLPTPALQFG